MEGVPLLLCHENASGAGISVAAFVKITRTKSKSVKKRKNTTE